MTAKRRRTRHPQAPPRTPPTETARGPFMTQTEVADLFRVTTPTVNRWIRKGALTPTRSLSGHKRFHTSEVLALAGLGRIGPDPEPGPPTAG